MWKTVELFSTFHPLYCDRLYFSTSFVAFMSRHPPEYPNLEHLKKRAKDLLRELQRQNSASKLAGAQRAIAREYGFASWPKLKALVESLPRPAAPSEATLAQVSVGMQGEVNPFVGEWTANLSKSRGHPLNQYGRRAFRIDLDCHARDPSSRS